MVLAGGKYKAKLLVALSIAFRAFWSLYAELFPCEISIRSLAYTKMPTDGERVTVRGSAIRPLKMVRSWGLTSCIHIRLIFIKCHLNDDDCPNVR